MVLSREGFNSILKSALGIKKLIYILYICYIYVIYNYLIIIDKISNDKYDFVS